MLNKKILTPIEIFGIFICIYLIIMVSGSWLFQSSNGLCIVATDTVAMSFFDCLYFTFISFHTIGYGDIIPTNNSAKVIVMIISFLSIIYTTFFAGLLIDSFVRKREAERFYDIAHKSLYEIIYSFVKNFISHQFINPTGVNFLTVTANTLKDENKNGVKHSIIKELDKIVERHYLASNNHSNMGAAGLTMRDEKGDVINRKHSIYDSYIVKITSLNAFKEKLDGFIVSYGQYVDSEKILLPLQKIENQIDDLFRYKKSI
jgi:hypothetical protein